jgi:hypothetical protein
MAEKKSSDWEKSITFQLRASPAFLKLLDDWRRKQDDLPSRSEAVRRLVEAGAGSDKPDRKKGSTKAK